MKLGHQTPNCSPVPQHKWLPTAPGVCSRCVCSRCVFVCVCVHGVCLCVCFHGVCVHLGWIKCRAQIPSKGHHTWSYVTSLIYNMHTYTFLLGYFLSVLFRSEHIYTSLWHFELLYPKIHRKLPCILEKKKGI